MADTATADTAAEPGGSASVPETADGSAGTRAREARLVLWAALGLIALQAVLRGWAALRGYFYIDDFAFISMAQENSAFDPDYLLHAYNSHVMPGSYLWVSALTALAPLSWTPVALVSIALQAILAVLCLLLLRELFGLRWLILVPLAVMLLSPISLPGFLWWAAALNQLPQQLAMILALLLHVRYLRTGRLLTGLLGVAAIAFGLLFSEKTLLAIPLIAAIHLAFFAAGPVRERLREFVTEHAIVVGAYALLAAAYTTYYLLAVPSPAGDVSTGQDMLDVGTEAVSSAILPGILGGPWTWESLGFAGGMAKPHALAALASFVLLTAAIVWSSTRLRGAGRGWLVLAGYIVAVIGLLAVSRATIVGPAVGREMRYLTDVGVVAGLCIGLAIIPLRAGPWRAASPMARAPHEGRHAERSAWRDQLGIPNVSEAPLSLALAGLLAISSAASTITYDRLWHPNPARAYVEGAKAQSTTRVIADGAVPPEVAWSLIAPHNTASRLLRSTDLRFMQPGDVSDRITALGSNGVPVDGSVTGVSAVPGPDPGCGWALGRKAQRIQLQGQVYQGVHLVRIGYLSGAKTRLRVTAGKQTAWVPVTKGLGAAYLVAEGPIDHITVAPDKKPAPVCTKDIRVGRPLPRVEAP
ncbi:hypothetical protein ACQP1U_08450 [Actinomycetota bacterium]